MASEIWKLGKLKRAEGDRVEKRKRGGSEAIESTAGAILGGNLSALSTMYRHSLQVAQVRSCTMQPRGQEILLTLVNAIDEQLSRKRVEMRVGRFLSQGIRGNSGPLNLNGDA